jgi:DNA polymerase-3 subunit gamma/tau
MTSARAAINAALEAARAASGIRTPPKRPVAEPVAPAPTAPSPAAPPPSAPGPSAALSSALPSAPQARAASAPPPWDGGQPQAMAQQPHSQAAMQARQQPQQQQDDDVPSWVTDFSDDTAVAAEAPAMVAPAPQVRAPAAPPHAYVVTPVPEIAWDGNWPALAGSLPLRGVAQQLALQTELVACVVHDRSVTFKLRVPVDTLRASGNSEKLAAALQEHFPDFRVNVESEIGPVWYTAGAEQKAAREERQRLAESIVAADPFVQELERRFDAFVVPGSVKVA